MDVLYYIGGGSSHNNDELRFSLRALEANCKDVGKVWIVGNRPEFLRNVEYLWIEDKFEWWKNAFIKVKAAIEAGISKQFLLMNDDFFMLKPFEAAKYPYYHKGEMPTEGNNDYKKVIVNTRRYLEQMSATTFHYGVHCPMVIDGKKFLEIEKHLTQPLSMRCLYGNLYCKGRKVKDVKTDEILPSVTKCYSAKANMSEKIYEELKTMFPKPSKWEEENV